MGCPLKLKMGPIVVKKPKLGTKRVCAECATKYYDLERDPIICPSCGTRFIPPEPKIRAKPTKPAKPPAVEPKAKEESTDGDQTVSLDAADAEATETGAVASESTESDDSDDESEEIAADATNGEPAEGEDDDKFLVRDDDESADVGAMIGDVNKDDN
jgi:uncharacterized protein (TIGR02300 family)